MSCCLLIGQYLMRDVGHKSRSKRWWKTTEKLLSPHIYILRYCQCISRCKQYNYLGVQLDECMTLTSNFNNIFKKFSYKIYQFGKIRKYLDIPTRILVYKQTILPLVEYVSFMLCLNNRSEVDKLQKLQNRCLRSCLNIYKPMDIGNLRLHQLTRVNTLGVRRDLQLLNMMFSFKQKNKYKKEGAHVTISIDRFVFDTDIVHKDIYARSPYYCGVSLWNSIPMEYQNLSDSCAFKNHIKKHLSIIWYKHLEQWTIEQDAYCRCWVHLC